jgi:hypothetical protein
LINILGDVICYVIIVSRAFLELADAHKRLPREEIEQIIADQGYLVEKPEPSPLMMDMEHIDYLIWVFNHVRVFMPSPPPLPFPNPPR